MLLRLYLVSCLASIAVSTRARAAESVGTLLQFDFEDAITWPVSTLSPTEPGVFAGGFGTINKINSSEASRGLKLVMDSGTQPAWVYGPGGLFQRRADVPIVAGGAKRAWTAGIVSGPQALRNSETVLGKLTLSFSLSVSRALPVNVRVESFNAARERTGALQANVFPAAADFYQRYALDLSTLKATGDGVFDPLAPYVGFSFETGSTLGWPSAAHHELRLDNVHYACAAYYVSQTGSDEHDGRSESNAFATPQKALDAARPGDIILLMNGTYEPQSSAAANAQSGREPLAKFTRAGTPAGWLTLKNYPGHRPILSAHGQTAISIVQKKDQPSLCYIEIRGLRILGNGETARAQYPTEIGKSSPNTDSMGIVVNARYTPWPGARTDGELIHNIRIADNVVEYCTADGIYVEYCDWLFVERNVIQNNCWTTTGYAPSGLSVMGYANFDSLDNCFKMLIAGNQVSGNRLTVPNHPRGQLEKTTFYNGNGILLDANAEKISPAYLGRTLVQNNLVFDNGGGGIQMWGSHRLDVINNTIYQNGTVLRWGQVAMERCRDVRLINNIIVGLPDGPLDTWVTGRGDERTGEILRASNLYWGGNEAHVSGFNDLLADPQFVSGTSDPDTADFRLSSTSPASKAGRWDSFTPIVDLDGQLRPASNSPSVGAFQTP